MKPGAVRLAAEVASQAEGSPLLVSAFKNRKTLTVVVINASANDVTAELHINDGRAQFTASYLTSQGDELKARKITGDKNVIPSRSIITFTGIIQ